MSATQLRFAHFFFKGKTLKKSLKWIVVVSEEQLQQLKKKAFGHLFSRPYERKIRWMMMMAVVVVVSSQKESDSKKNQHNKVL